jgi:cytochrome c oxidase cbb3-type subunit 1
MLNNPNVPFANIIMYIQPYLALRSIAGTLMTIGHIAFATSFIINIAGWGRQRSGGPTLFAQPPQATPIELPKADSLMNAPATPLQP